MDQFRGSPRNAGDKEAGGRPGLPRPSGQDLRPIGVARPRNVTLLCCLKLRKPGNLDSIL